MKLSIRVKRRIPRGGGYCVEIFAHVNCNTDEDGNLINCRVIAAQCDTWESIAPPGNGEGVTGGGTGDDGDDDHSGGGGSTPPDGDEEDPCDHLNEPEDPDNPGNGHDNNEGFHGIPECDECDLPNPPYWCPADDDEEDEEPEPCATGYGFIDDPNIQQALQTLWENSNYGNRENPNPDSTRVEQGGT